MDEEMNCISLSVVTYFTIVQEKDSYIAKLQKNEKIVTTLQKQVEQSNQQSKCTCVCIYMLCI